MNRAHGMEPGKPRTRRLALLAVAALAMLGSAPATSGAALASRGARSGAVSTLGARLRSAGRGSVSFERVSVDAVSGRTRSERGRLALELPDRVSLDFTRTGERITLRKDGGEWLQPGLQQMIVFDARHAGAARHWWRLLMEGAAPDVRVERHGARRIVLLPSGETEPDSASLILDPAGLPRSLEFPDPSGMVSFRFRAWTFGPRQGERRYRQRAPEGYEVVPMP